MAPNLPYQIVTITSSIILAADIIRPWFQSSSSRTRGIQERFLSKLPPKICLIGSIVLYAISLLCADAYNLDTISSQEYSNRSGLLVAATICFIHYHFRLIQMWLSSMNEVRRDLKSHYTKKELEVMDGKLTFDTYKAEEQRGFWLRNSLVTALALALSMSSGIPLWAEWTKS